MKRLQKTLLDLLGSIPEYADPDHHQHGVRGRYRLHREIPD